MLTQPPSVRATSSGQCGSVTAAGSILADMRSLRIAFGLGLLIAYPADSFEVYLWPGEGIPVVRARSPIVALHTEASRSAPVAKRVAVTPDTQIAFDETRYRTIASGQMIAIAPGRVKGRLLGEIASVTREDYYQKRFPPADIAVASGDTVEYLQYRAEGTCFVRVHAQTIDADPCPANGEPAFRLDSEPVVEWWIRATIGDASGWLLVDGQEVRVIERNF